MYVCIAKFSRHRSIYVLFIPIAIFIFSRLFNDLKIYIPFLSNIDKGNSTYAIYLYVFRLFTRN